MSEDDRVDPVGVQSQSSASTDAFANRDVLNPPQSDRRTPIKVTDAPLEAVDEDPTETIERAFRQRDARALKYLRRRLNLTVFAVALGPVAVLLLATQVIVFPHGGTRGSLLIVTELIVLTLALAIGFLQMGRSHRLWIRERLRAEIVRREGYLLRVRVGPYLNVPEPALAEKVRERLVTIDSDVSDPVALLPMQDEAEDWRDALEDSRHRGILSETPDFSANLHSYLTVRTKIQRQWFSKYSRILGKRARLFENGARLVLLLALVIAALHLALLAAGETKGFGHEILIIFAIVAPTIGSAFVGLQAISGSQRLSRSYVYFAHELEPCEKRFRRVRARMQETGVADDELQFEFKRGVLDTEALLSKEMHVWWLIMHTEAPRAAA